MGTSRCCSLTWQRQLKLAAVRFHITSGSRRTLNTHSARKRRVITPMGKLGFHDDSLASVIVYPKAKGGSRIDFSFTDYNTKEPKSLSFRGCANLRCNMDFDVLANNWFAQTEGVDCVDDVRKMQKFVRAQIAHWHVRYMPPMPVDQPIKRKVASIRSYQLFRVKFFGGTFEVLAKTCVASKLKKGTRRVAQPLRRF
jgi:hypothetical protein